MLDRSMGLRLRTAIEKELSSEEHEGQPLSGEFAGLFRIRVGDYRVIYARGEDAYLVLRIGHRGDVYRRGGP